MYITDRMMYITCCCSLAGTVACFTCPSRYQYEWWRTPYTYYPAYPDITYPKPHSKKIIEKFDKDGKLIERIVEEESPEYNYSWKIVNTDPNGQYKAVDNVSTS